MKRNFSILCVLFAFLITGCSIGNRINVDKERIGVEYTVITDQPISTNDSHGSVENYTSDYSKDIWTTKFDSMDSTGELTLDIEAEDSLKITCDVTVGDVWLKITQGDISKSKIQKIQGKNGETVEVDLSQWNSGENGIIKVEHLKSPH